MEQKPREKVMPPYHLRGLNFAGKMSTKSNAYTPLIAVHLLVENRSKS